MGARRSKRNGKEEVELNLAAMLDMAFQLLTFFILTFRPAPVEGDIALRLPPPLPIGIDGNLNRRNSPGDDPKNLDPITDFHSLIIDAFPDRSGHLQSLAIGDSPVDLAQLDRELQRIFREDRAGFDQVIIHAGSGLRYDALMSIIDICSRQTLPTGGKLKKLSFVEMANGSS